MNVKNRILSEAEKDYKNFSQSFIPSIDNVLGVRLPVLRKIAKEIYAKGNWQGFLKQTDFEYMEETRRANWYDSNFEEIRSKVNT